MFKSHPCYYYNKNKMEIRTLNEVIGRFERLNQNVGIIKNEQGKRNVSIMMSALKKFIENPNFDLRKQLDNSSGTEQRTFLWICGELI